MKKIYYTIVFFMSISFLGCNDEKNVDLNGDYVLSFSGTIEGFENIWQGKNHASPDQLCVYAVKDENVIVANKLYVPQETAETAEFLCMDHSPMQLKDDNYVFYSYRVQEESNLSGNDGLYVELSPCQIQQKGNDNQHIRENDYIYAKGVKDKEKVRFQYKHAFTMLEFTLPAGIRGLVVRGSKQTDIYSGSGSFSIKSGQWNAWSDKYPCVNLKLEESIVRDGDKAWMLIMPGHQGQSFDLIVQTDEHKIYKIRKTVPEEGFLSGQKYEIEVDLQAAEEVLNPPLQKNGVWQLSTAQDLEWFRDNVNCGTVSLNGALTATIDLKGSKQNPWWPIGLGNSFQGSFDGNGYSIKGLYIDGLEVESGLWSVMEAPAQIFDLQVAGLLSGQNISYTGSIAAVNDGGVIARCYSKVDFDHQSGLFVGGIVGYNGGEVRDCYYGGNIKVDAGKFIGGIFSQNQGVVENCYNAGTFSLGSAVVGGIGGGNNPGGIVRNCAALCTTWKDIAGAYYNVIGRILAFNSGESYNHIAYEGIILENPVSESVSVQGITKGRMDCLLFATYTKELGWSSEIWGSEENELPYLKVLRDVEGRVPEFK